MEVKDGALTFRGHRDSTVSMNSMVHGRKCARLKFLILSSF